jgi:hypothetical protein
MNSTFHTVNSCALPDIEENSKEIKENEDQQKENEKEDEKEEGNLSDNIPNDDREKMQKIHEKMLEDDLNGVESKLTKQFLSDSKFIQDQMENEPPKASSVPKKFKTKKPPEGVLPHKFKIDQITRKLDEQYFKDLKQTTKIPKNSEKIFEELEQFKQKVNEIKQVNRDEELLRMQKENQEIEEKLNELKQQDNSELKEKQESCRKLVEQFNILFNERKKRCC